MVKILCAGHAALDMIFDLGEFPEENRKYLVEDVAESSGGPAANAASLLARWGVPVALMAPLGADSQGDLVRKDLASDGVQIDLLDADPRYPTPFSTILTSQKTGTRTILTRRPSRPPVSYDKAHLAAMAPASAVEGLVFDGHEPEVSLELLNLYPRAWSLLDAGTLRPGTETLAGRVTYLLTSEAFASALLGRRDPERSIDFSRQSDRGAGLAALRELSDGWVGITLGEKGCVWFDPFQKTRGVLPAMDVTAVDTTGAGDLFHGAFAFGLLREKNVESALVWATCAAGLSVQRKGGRNSIPSFQEARSVFDRWQIQPGSW